VSKETWYRGKRDLVKDTCVHYQVIAFAHAVNLKCKKRPSIEEQATLSGGKRDLKVKDTCVEYQEIAFAHALNPKP